MAYNLNYNPGTKHEYHRKHRKVLINLVTVLILIVLLILVFIGWKNYSENRNGINNRGRTTLTDEEKEKILMQISKEPQFTDAEKSKQLQQSKNSPIVKTENNSTSNSSSNPPSNYPSQYSDQEKENIIKSQVLNP